MLISELPVSPEGPICAKVTCQWLLNHLAVPSCPLGATGKRPQRPVVLSRYGRGRCFGVERRL